MKLRALCRLGLLAVATTCLASCGFPDYGIDTSSGQADGGPDVVGTDGPEAAPPEGGGGDSGDADVSPPDADAAGLDAADEADATDEEGDVVEAAAECLSGADCTDPTKPLCHLSTGRCGACLPSTDDCPYGQYCEPASLTCEAGCKNVTDCVPPEPDAGKPDDAGGDDGDADAGDQDAGPDDGGSDGAVITDAGNLQCDLTTHQCVGCQLDDDCLAGTICQGNSCVPGCTAQHGCQTGRECCTGTCVATESDPDNCGDCGNVCTALVHATAGCSGGTCGIGACISGWADCDDVAADGCEVNIATSMTSCGECGVACAPSHAIGACTGGICSIVSCSAGYADCDLSADNGCEISTTGDVLNCSGCGKECPLPAHATPACIGAACEIATCDAGYADCNASAADGCETNTQASPTNCGGCGVACSLANGNAICAGGQCQLASCQAPFASCDGQDVNGCEVNLSSDPTHCGTCPQSCSYANATPLCTNSACDLGPCASGFGNCDANKANGCETNLGSSTQNCGACGTVCTAAHATPTCTNTVCDIAACTPPWDDCNTQSTDGCETNTTNNVSNCGGCGVVCSFAHASASCASSACVLGTCDGGYADCDGAADTGCEANTNTSIAHCGGCNNACSANHGTPSCTGGGCGIVCSAGFANCDGDVTNGCETATTSSVSACGGCGITCSVAHGTPTCTGSACEVLSCTGFWGDCDGLYSDGCEKPLNTLTDCGSCGQPCAPGHATGSCAAGTCAILACDSGYADCDGNPANGCEVNLATDINHCGTCPNKCPTSCAPSCTNGACGCSSCAAGSADCNSNPGDGCEINTTNDPSNCGGCGITCTAANGTAACVNSACVVATCDAGYSNCDSQYANGCETHVSVDPAHCGACTTTCSSTNGTATCASGTCGITCNAGFGSCDGNAANGCEVNLATDAVHCGTCATVCDTTNGTASCAGGACGITCNAGYADCDGSASNGCEVHTATDPTHCGACTTACSSANGTAACAAGTCSITCDAGWGNCDGNIGNGCETSTAGSVSNCGTCGHVCSSNYGTASCTAGTCSIACSSGHGNCDGNVDNGCETDVNASTSNCGACGRACSGSNVASASCSGGLCNSTCNANYGNCTTPSAPAVDDGCETNVGTSTSDCGGCGRACSGVNVAALACSGGLCTSTCSSGYGNCTRPAAPSLDNGCETAVTNDTSNCGGCGRACSSSNVTTLACSGGLCASTCTSGRGNCNQPAAPVADDGCEASVTADVNNCGGCNRACSSAHAQTLSCSAGVCNSSCVAGYGNCATPTAPTVDDGCEANISTSTANCGSCGRACSTANVAIAACAGGLCTPSCNSGYGNCTMPSSPTADDGCELNVNTQCAGSTCCGTLCTALHDNGLGQTYSDCHALGVPGNAATYTATMANEAATAWPGAGSVLPAQCGNGGDKSDCVYKVGTSCAVWCYTNGSTHARAGWVYVNTQYAPYTNCYCPTPDATDKPWY